MASVQLDAASGHYRIRFRFGGKGYFRSLHTRNEAKANALCGRVEAVINAIDQGFLTLPAGVDPGEFILAGGKIVQPPGVIAPPKSITVEALLAIYAEQVNRQSKEGSSFDTEAIHRGHLTRQLGRLAVDDVRFETIQDYVAVRQRDGREPVTIKKELATLRMVWNWALRRKRVAAPVPWRMGDLEFAKTPAKEPFKTWAEIERRIQRDRLEGEESASLWESLYLDEGQVKECLEYVQGHAVYPFVHPMFAFAAYTGARRGEILRAEREDFQFDSGTVAIRQKKADRTRHFTFRHVPLHPDLAVIMKEWFGRHPGTTPAICTPEGQRIAERMATKYFRQAVSKSKWQVLRGFHVFRHSMASIMATKGIDQRVINAILGHSTEAMVRRYQHLFPQKAEATIRQLFA